MGNRGEPVRLGVVGLGVMGAEMVAAAQSLEEFEVVRVFDVNPEAAGRVDVPFAANVEEILAADDVDAVYFATPPKFHAEPVIAAIRAGKAVFCEKPLAVSLDDGRRMIEAAAEHGVAAAVNFALSNRDAVLEVERALADGEVGEVRGVDVRLHFPRWPRDFQSTATWVGGKEQGGFVREVLSHFVYVTDRLLGPLEAVDVSLDAPDEGEIAARGLLRAGDVPVHVSGFAGIAAPELYEWVLWGTRRSYLLRNWAQLFVSDGGEWTPVPMSGPRGSDAERLSLFAAAIRGEHPRALADFASGLRVQHVIEAFHSRAG